MPTYDYRCRSCGTVTEVIHAMTDDGPTICERCGGELRRVFFPAGIIFKGSGFYRTDSRSNGDAAPSTKTTPAAKPAESGTATSSGSSETNSSGSSEKSTTGGSTGSTGSTSGDTSG